MKKHFNILLFPDFTILDVFGPVEVITKLPNEYEVKYFSLQGGLITGSGNTKIETLPLEAIDQFDVFLIPGGFGTRSEVNNSELLKKIKETALLSTYVLTVCTGSALLAKTGLLDGIKATSNKLSFDWVKQQGPEVNWVRKARWVNDQKYFTSSGISAGIDMTLAFIAATYNTEAVKKIAQVMEYTWNSDKDNDVFA